MATILREINRYVPWHGLYDPPTARPAYVRLVQWGPGIPGDDVRFMVHTPWACLDGSGEMTETDLARYLPNSFATAEEAEQAAKRVAPFAGKDANERIRTEVIDSIRHYGNICGPSRVADRYLVGVDHILAVARGERKAPKLPKAKTV